MDNAIWGTIPNTALNAVAREEKEKKQEDNAEKPLTGEPESSLRSIHTYVVISGKLAETWTNTYNHSLISSALTSRCMMTTSSASVLKESWRALESLYNPNPSTIVYFYFLKQLKVVLLGNCCYLPSIAKVRSYLNTRQNFKASAISYASVHVPI